MAPDLVERVIRDFANAHVAALARLELTQGALPLADAATATRVLRCAVHLAAGDLDRLNQWLADARRDWRNVILEAEYAPGVETWGDIRVRDFARPFGQEAL
jgi:hypothetical protein